MINSVSHTMLTFSNQESGMDLGLLLALLDLSKGLESEKAWLVRGSAHMAHKNVT